jgi:hypothetical protein
LLKERSNWQGVRVLELYNSIYQAGRWPMAIYPACLRLSLVSGYWLMLEMSNLRQVGISLSK